jgi:hypothetical protein
MEFAAMLIAGELEFFQIELVVRFRAEYLGAVVAANDYMLRLVGDNESG